MQIYVLKLNYYDTAERTRYFASGRGFNGKPDDTPANLWAPPLLVNPGNYESNLFQRGTTIGSSEAGNGEIRLNNATGELDEMRDYGYDREWVLYRGDDTNALFPAGFVQLDTGIIHYADYSETEIILSTTNRQGNLYEQPIVNTVFSGDTTDTTYGSGCHINATPDDYGGKSLPWVIGNGGGDNFEPPLVNPGKQTFMVSLKRMNDDLTVFMRGAALTPGTKHASITALQAATVVSGEFDYYLGDGGEGTKCLFRVGSALDGKVTVSGTAYRASGEHTAGNCAADIFTEKGMTLDATSVTALNAVATAKVGYYVPTGGMRVGDVLDAVLSSVGAAWFDTAGGVFKVALLANPEGGASRKTFKSKLLLGPERVRRVGAAEPGNGAPCSRIEFRYNRNYTLMSEADAAGIVASDPQQLQRLKNEWKSFNIDADSGVLTKYPQALPFVIESYIVDDAEAETEAERQLDLRVVYHDHVEITVDVRDALADDDTALSLGDVVTLEYDRYSETGVDKYLILGIVADYAVDSVSFLLWRPRL